MPANGPWQVRIVGNRYPALSDDGDAGAPIQRARAAHLRRRLPRGDRRVAAATTPALASRQPAEVARIFRTFIDRAWMVQTRPRASSTFSFSRTTAGRPAHRCCHPHAQMMALPMVPNDVRVRADAGPPRTSTRSANAPSARCSSRNSTDGAPHHPGEPSTSWPLRPMPRCRPFTSGSCPSSTCRVLPPRRSTAEVDDLGEIMHAVLRKLYVGLNNPDYNYAIRTAPVRDLGAPYLHWYITIVPRISLPPASRSAAASISTRRCRKSAPSTCADVDTSPMRSDRPDQWNRH